MRCKPGPLGVLQFLIIPYLLTVSPQCCPADEQMLPLIEEVPAPLPVPPQRLATSVQSDQFDTSFASWPTEGKPLAAILSIHGFGLHKGSFDAFAKRMVKANISVYAIDVRGFGSWAEPDSKRQPLDFYNTLVDVGTTLSWVKKMNPGVPLILLGESMGGVVALQATAMFPDEVDGLISSVPGSLYYNSNKTNMEVALHMMHPDRPFDIGSKVIEQATQNTSLRNSWEADPKARLQLSPKELVQFHLFMKKSHQMARLIRKTPVLMIQGVQDKLAKPDGTIKLFNELQTKDKDLVMLGRAEHLIFEGAQFDDRIIDLVSGWIIKHCPTESKNPS